MLMTFSTFKECLAKVPADVDIHFSGMCEPWLNPECTRMVRYAGQAGYRLNIFTSLVGMNVSDVEVLAGLSLGAFVVHLPSSQGYEKIAIDDQYVATLRRLDRSGMVTAWICHSTTVHPSVRPIVGGKIRYFPLITRAGNIRVVKGKRPEKHPGPIRCARNLRQNVLLPNGEVLLCCMDYGMKHILGNLKENDYLSLFASKEFLGVQRGLDDPSLDVLCRRCDYFARDKGIFANLRSTLLAKIGRIRQ